MQEEKIPPLEVGGRIAYRSKDATKYIGMQHDYLKVLRYLHHKTDIPQFIPYSKIGTIIVYYKDDLDKYLRESRFE